MNLRALIRAVTEPLPSTFPRSEPGLMTQEEYLHHRNPSNRYHEDGWDYRVEDMNRDYTIYMVGVIRTSREPVDVYKTRYPDSFLFKRDRILIGVLHHGTLYHSSRLNPRGITGYFDTEQDRNWHEITWDRVKTVKYPMEYMHLVSHVAADNRDKYPYLYQNIKIGKEPAQIRFERAPEKNKGIQMVILNSEGLVVAGAYNEWGATLLVVTREYRRKGLGTLLGSIWSEWNPRYLSGGFTGAGYENAIRMWSRRVRHFLSKGWYSALIQQGQLTKERVNAILADLPERPKLKDKVPVGKSQVLVMIDPGISFYVYDSRFYDDPDDKYIYGFGFYRDSGDKIFLYRIDYDRKYAKLCTTIALQMARDEGFKVYNGSGYGDTLELEGIEHLEQEGDLVYLTQDVLPLDAMSRLEKHTRQQHDPYGQYMAMIMEQAEAKWD